MFTVIWKRNKWNKNPEDYQGVERHSAPVTFNGSIRPLDAKPGRWLRHQVVIIIITLVQELSTPLPPAVFNVIIY